MPSHYSVVQYVPDPATGERINVGIIAVGETGVAAKFVHSWARVECFAAGRDIAFLREFAVEMESVSVSQLGFSELHLPEGLNVQMLTQYASKWHNALQLTTPAASRRSPEETVAALAPRFLAGLPDKPAVKAPHRVRTRNTAAAIGYSALSLAVHRHPDSRDGLFRVVRREWLSGRLEAYPFDSVAMNGRPLAAMHGLSFEAGKEDELNRTVDALALAVRDVLEEQTLPIGVVALIRPEQEGTGPHRRAVHLLTEFGAAVLDENSAPSWAMEAFERSVAGKWSGPAGDQNEPIPIRRLA
jgi:hypothetical protein